MSIIYKWTDSSKKFLFKINGNIYTAFKVTNTGDEGQEYQAWLAEGNTPLPPDEPDPWQAIREKRDQLIASSDWTMIPGATVDQAQWSAYRQILRDIPQTYTNPEDVIWPTPPSTSGPNTIEE